MEISTEMQAAIDAAVEAATEKLKTKNSELIAEVRTLKSAKTAAEEAAETAAEEAQRKAGDITALEKTLTDKHAKAIKSLEEQLDAATKEVATFKVDAVITKALIDGGVTKGMMIPLDSMFKTQAAANKLSGDDLAAHIATTLASPEGREWVPAPVNVGTGATGVKVPTGGHGFTKENFNARMGEWATLSVSDPTTAKQIAESCGRTDLANSL